MSKREVLVLLIADLMSNKKLSFTSQFIELERQKNELLPMKKLYRKYRVVCNMFYKAYPELV